MPKVSTLMPHALLRPLISSELAPDAGTMEHFLGYCHRHRYPNRTDVFRPGDNADTLHYVVSGTLSIISEEADGRELVLSYLNPGDFIGELGLFVKTERREVLLRTRSPVELAEISYERLLSLFHGPLAADCPRLLYAIASQLAKRLLETSRKASRLAFMDVSGRILRTLLDLCNEPEALSHPDGTQIRVSRQELARIAGCSREMAGRVLKQMQTEGLLHARGKTVVIYRATRDDAHV